ncbi:MAG: tryptophan synthase subunit alpha [Actinomycetes bacterium]
MSLTPLQQLFINLKSENRAALIGYVPAGFPSKLECIEVIKAMVAGGVDAIEIGYPYSDPVMDGPIIQAAADQSLRGGTGAADVFAVLKATTELGVPAVVMTYWNPIERYGIDNFARDLQAAGGSGVITPDLTIEESLPWASAAEKHGINRIYVVAPSTLGKRLTAVTHQCSGFVYAASLMGVTGTRTSVSAGAEALVARVREVTDTPISVGLGVSTREQAHEVARYADGVIVGSAFIRLIQESATFAEGLLKVQELAAELADGVRR